MTEVTISTKNQIVVPREAREALGVKAGDRLLVVVRGNRVVILQKPNSHHAALRGLAPVLYSEGYLQKERQSWE
jgi:AbrB family looped-hinge helix DNA binding protein